MWLTSIYVEVNHNDIADCSNTGDLIQVIINEIWDDTHLTDPKTEAALALAVSKNLRCPVMKASW